jgi:hypothetical protein
MPKISGPNYLENRIIETFKEEGCAISTQDIRCATLFIPSAQLSAALQKNRCVKAAASNIIRRTKKEVSKKRRLF